MAVVVRSRHDPRMRAYVERRSQKSLLGCHAKAGARTIVKSGPGVGSGSTVTMAYLW